MYMTQQQSQISPILFSNILAADEKKYNYEPTLSGQDCHIVTNFSGLCFYLSKLSIISLPGANISVGGEPI